jgi:hypothetical protein
MGSVDSRQSTVDSRMRNAIVTLVWALLIGAVLFALAHYFDLPMVREAGGRDAVGST